MEPPQQGDKVQHIYRLATTDDASEIFDALEEVAPEIPVRLDTPDRQNRLLERIQAAINASNVWIALDRSNQVVGFLLGEPYFVVHDGEPRFDALDMSYGGVRTSHRKQHIFADLLKKMKDRGLPLIATVMHSNTSNMLDCLLKLDFTKVFPSPNDRDFLRWQPQRLIAGNSKRG